MKTFKIKFANGNTITTGFNGSLEEIKKYYLNNKFNIGAGEDDLQIAVEVIEIKS